MSMQEKQPLPAKESSAANPVSADTASLVDASAQLARRVVELEKQWREAQRRAELAQRDRKLVAYEIHDGMLQDITAAAMYLDVADALWATDNQEARQHVQQALSLVRAAMAEARRLIGGIQLPVLEAAGLAAAVQALIDEHRQRSSIEFDVDVRIHSLRLLPTVEVTAFRALQEALTNAERYSGAQRITVRIRETAEALELSVQDDGKGFDPNTVRSDRFGLLGIRERAELLGGCAAIRTAPGQGTTIALTIPLKDRLLQPTE